MHDLNRDQHSADVERKDEATDSRTLSEIEEEEKVSGSNSNSPTPSPDAEADHFSGDGDAGDPM